VSRAIYKNQSDFSSRQVAGECAGGRTNFSNFVSAEETVETGMRDERLCERKSKMRVRIRFWTARVIGAEWRARERIA
jgi:hypothetical protein